MFIGARLPPRRLQTYQLVFFLASQRYGNDSIVSGIVPAETIPRGGKALDTSTRLRDLVVPRLPGDFSDGYLEFFRPESVQDCASSVISDGARLCSPEGKCFRYVTCDEDVWTREALRFDSAFGFRTLDSESWCDGNRITVLRSVKAHARPMQRPRDRESLWLHENKKFKKGVGAGGVDDDLIFSFIYFFCIMQIAVCCFKCLQRRFLEPVKGFANFCDNLNGSKGWKLSQIKTRGCVLWIISSSLFF